MNSIKIFLFKKNVVFLCILSLILYACNISATKVKRVKKEIIVKGLVGSADGEVELKPYEHPSLVPSTIAIDSNGNIYLADPANERIQKFDKTGKFMSKIKFIIDMERYKNIKRYDYYPVGDYIRGEIIIIDMATDKDDNLYIVSRPLLKIDKYSPDGKFLQSIDLHQKDICWNKKKGWFNCVMNIEGLIIDVAGNIYLQGEGELIKFSPIGIIEKKWGTMPPIFFLDNNGNLYWSKEGIWEKYDSSGNMVGAVECEKPYFRLEKDGCYYPRFIDKNGLLYFYKSGSPSTKGLIVFKGDQQGKRYGEYIIPYSDFHGNNIRFDADGNLYILHYAKDGFWIEKISWD
jgi:hypothetical protein